MEELSGENAITRGAFEERVVAEVKDLLDDPYLCRRADFDSIALERVDQKTDLVVLFRIRQRPDCTFGRRTQIWPEPCPNDPDFGGPEGAAGLVAMHLDELITQGGLVVRAAEPEGPTWV